MIKSINLICLVLLLHLELPNSTYEIHPLSAF